MTLDILSSQQTAASATVETPYSRSAMRRQAVESAADQLADYAQAAGWRVRQRLTFSRGDSIYITLRATKSREVDLRISNHCPNPIDPKSLARPLLLVVPKVPGAFDGAKRFLKANGSPARIPGRVVSV